MCVFLVLIRAYEFMFSDPFIEFFKLADVAAEKPEYSFWHLFLSHSIRYDFNAITSLGIIYLLFRDRDVVKFSLFFYVIAFLILFPVYYILLNNLNPENYQTTFYVRRFLIQPVFLLLLVPAFYYQKYKM
ncbi:MAG: exosortase F system-associated protein [Flavobacteriaceae bacterium]|nr:exosortase F system-associated protein [Flavobacteriaceae bacterium]